MKDGVEKADLNDTAARPGADAVRELINNAAKYDLPERMTDLGNARRLVRLRGADLRYVHFLVAQVAHLGGRPLAAGRRRLCNENGEGCGRRDVRRGSARQ